MKWKDFPLIDECERLNGANVLQRLGKDEILSVLEPPFRYGRRRQEFGMEDFI